MKDPKITIQDTQLLSDNHYLLKKVTYEYKTEEVTETHKREVFDRGNGATILLFNKPERTVVLIRQFRLPSYLNGNPTGMLVEACAGMLEEENPDDTIRREVEEETGYYIKDVKKIYEAYMSPGAVTEILHLYIGEYTKEMKQGEGGGLASENEHIQILELPFDEALDMLDKGAIKDAKTIMLLQYAALKQIFNT